MKTLVTGGAGFIGTHLVQRLLDAGDEIVILDSLEEQVHAGETPLVPDGVTLHVGDVGDAEIVDRALEGVDRVVHLAAAVGVGQSMYEIARYTQKNTMATAVFLERLVARDPRPSRLVVASSMSIYGEGEYVCPEHGRRAPHPRPETQLIAREWEVRCPDCGQTLEPVPTSESKPLIPTSIYAINKRDHEEMSIVTGSAYGIPTVALRFFNVYGPGQALSNPYTGVAAIFASRLLNGNPPAIFEDGEQSRDFIHVSDIVEGVLCALTSEQAAGHAVNLGTGRRCTINDVARILGEGLKVTDEPKRLQQYRAGDIRHCFADVTAAQELLGFRAATSLEDGMNDLLQWLLSQEADDRVDQATTELTRRGLAR
jgi:dTDP-L-rhamnose 4-epimerase